MKRAEQGAVRGLANGLLKRLGLALSMERPTSGSAKAVGLPSSKSHEKPEPVDAVRPGLADAVQVCAGEGVG